MNMSDEQLVLDFGSGTRCETVRRRQRRRGTAQRWFKRMREVAEAGFYREWAPSPRAEQIWFEERKGKKTARSRSTRPSLK